jgi:signal transduction histidine kinase/CheY-like chemotaxis protein
MNAGAPASGVPSTELPLAAQAYVGLVIAGGALSLIAAFPRTFPQPVLFGVLTVFACLTSIWKVNLPITVANGATLSVSYAANLMSLLLLGPQYAVVIAVPGALTQCLYRQKAPYPIYRTIFSAATAAITMTATGAVFVWLGGSTLPIESFPPAKPLVAAIGTYFLVNTSLIAGAIALSSNRSFTETWGREFLWSGASFMVAGSAGALAAVMVQRGDHWMAVVLVAPIYLTYRSYKLFAGRLEDQKRHTEEMRGLHKETVAALEQARGAERALAAEKERLAVALVEMTRLEEQQKELLVREHAARESAEEANRLKDEFLAMVSHELRTPLNAIIGWGEMLNQRTIEAALRDRALRGIFDSAWRQAHLIEDLLDVARIASGKMRLERSFVDVEDVIREALVVAQPSASMKAIRLVFNTEEWSAKVFGDRVRLQQIVSNLISNAIKFTPEQGLVEVHLRRDGDEVQIVVTDTGQGIAPEFLSCVFQMFRQADGSTTRRHSGLGLGLSIVKSLVEAHDGSVTAHSAGEGLGATFVVRLPVAVWERSPRTVAVNPPIKSIPDLPSLEGIRVLVVDDDEESREVVAANLRGCRAAVATAPSAAQAFELLQHEPFDVLLADIGMPVEDGYSLISRVRASGPPSVAGIPAAALTAFARDDDRERALAAGFQLHLSKPIEASALVAAVASLKG